MIHPKVKYATGGAVGASLIGQAIADLIISFLTTGLHLTLTETNTASIQILVVAVVSGAGALLAGYVKKETP